MNPAPGTTVVDRYVLERQIVDAPHVTLWRGRDQVLDRPVAVRIVAQEHPRLTAVLDAARATTQIDDRRVARVLDAAAGEDSAAGAYVVTAWANGIDLDAVLAEGPLEPDDAVSIVSEIAEVVTAAHTQGITHLALDPTNVVIDRSTDPEPGVTVLGLGVDAVLWPERCETSTDADAQARADARGLGALLYACLTARWPDTADVCSLRDAPRIGSRLCTPAQVSAAVPPALDVLCRRALGEDVGGGPLGSPAEVCTALEELSANRTSGGRFARWFGRGARTARR